jgi:transaldolase
MVDNSGGDASMSAQEQRTTERAGTFDETVVSYGRKPAVAARPRFESSALLGALGKAGTTHLYADTADVTELGNLITTSSGAILGEIDGNTANQPLVHKVIARYLAEGDPAGWAQELRALRPALRPRELMPLVYAIICGRIGSDVVQAFAAGRSWEVSLQLHMELGADAEAAKRIGRYLRRMVPSAIVKVPFTPHAPQCFLVARDLEREGIPVNFTSTFSARQAVAAALLANVERTNIFLGRLNQGLKADLLGEQACLAGQRALREVRRATGVKTQLIVASVREWQTFPRLAGCDVFTAPCDAIRGFLTQTEVPAVEIRTQLETSYEDQLGVADDVIGVLGAKRLARLYTVEPELVQFMTELRRSVEYDGLRDGDALYKRFDQAGFADLFYAPSGSEWQELRRSKLPDLGSPLTERLPLDTLYTLLADADFDKYQEQMDAQIAERVGA